MMKKKYLLAVALALTAMVSCTDESFVGDQGLKEANESVGAIKFVSNTPAITRTERTGSTAAGDLDYSFAVYATKTVESTTSNVFAHNAYSDADNTPYWVWYNTSTANTTTSNTADWEYVGAAGSKTTPGGSFTLSNAQTIKYWDYAATNYVFTAYKNKAVGEPAAAGTVSNVTTSGFTFAGTAAQFAGLYVADKVTITTKSNPAAHGTADNKIGDAVKFTFRSGAAKVRMGIYQTIPGYEVKNVKFKPNASEFDESVDYARLTGSFNGSSKDASGTFTVSYDGDGKAVFTTTAATADFFLFGGYTTSGTNYLGKTSTSPTWANGSSDYISVLPNTDHTGNMILRVDFDLYNTTTQETIHITDAKAVVPQIYMTWNPNYAYTYLFKISDNTNGYTGPAASPTGLYPITFDAVTIAADDVQEGSITTVSTPSITTYQNGSVSASGIAYANAKGKIYITVNTDGTLATLNASGTTVKLYTVAAGTTEADLMLASGYTKTEVTTGTDVMNVQTSAETVNSVAFIADKYATFTPTANTTYAFEYAKDAVTAVYTQVTSGTPLTKGKKYYTSSAGEGEFTAGESDTAGDSTYELTTPAEPAVKAYKIIQIVPAS